MNLKKKNKKKRNKQLNKIFLLNKVIKLNFRFGNYQLYKDR